MSMLSLCGYYDLYVYTTISMCILRSLWGKRDGIIQWKHPNVKGLLLRNVKSFNGKASMIYNRINNNFVSPMNYDADCSRPIQQNRNAVNYYQILVCVQVCISTRASRGNLVVIYGKNVLQNSNGTKSFKHIFCGSESCTCGQSYKGSTIINYDSTVVTWGVFKSSASLES